VFKPEFSITDVKNAKFLQEAFPGMFSFLDGIAHLDRSQFAIPCDRVELPESRADLIHYLEEIK